MLQLRACTNCHQIVHFKQLMLCCVNFTSTKKERKNSQQGWEAACFHMEPREGPGDTGGTLPCLAPPHPAAGLPGTRGSAAGPRPPPGLGRRAPPATAFTRADTGAAGSLRAPHSAPALLVGLDSLRRPGDRRDSGAHFPEGASGAETVGGARKPRLSPKSLDLGAKFQTSSVTRTAGF